MADVKDDAWAEALVGKTLLERYRIERVLGSGGMGVVLEARHLRLDRPVAIKMMHPLVARDHASVDRFHQEARSAASVGIEGVVDVLDLDIDPEHGAFLAMEKLEGHSLVHELNAGTLETARALWVVTELLDVLQAVHERGIVHRDLKPPNIFIHRDKVQAERVKVLDFGIAKVRRSQLTKTGQVMGTPRFMAPEQARGDDVDARADVYAAGLLLYCCLTGVPPFASAPSERVMEYVLEGLPSLGTLRPDLPAPLVDAVDRAVALNASDRFASAAEFATALRFGDVTVPPAEASGADTMRKSGPASSGAQHAMAGSGIAGSGMDERAIAEPQHAAPEPATSSWRRATWAVALAALATAAAFAFTARSNNAPVAHLEAEGPCIVPLGEVQLVATPSGDVEYGNEGARIRFARSAGSVHARVALIGHGTAFVAQACLGDGRGCVEGLLRHRAPSASNPPRLTLHRVRLEASDGQACFVSGTVGPEL
ncbi:MAG: serine/threonine-protein kinase [Myxococcota bacterium]